MEIKIHTFAKKTNPEEIRFELDQYLYCFDRKVMSFELYDHSGNEITNDYVKENGLSVIGSFVVSYIDESF